MRIDAQAAELTRRRIPFVRVTVVRAQCPSSARAGDRALVLADGTIDGFVGGHCAIASVRVAALNCLAEREPVLLRVLPSGELAYPESPGARQTINPCLSGGALEIFLEPTIPAPVIQVVGDSPVATAVRRTAEMLGYEVDEHLREGTVAAVVASHGDGDAEAVRAALDDGLGFVGLVASHRRAGKVLAAMGLDERERDRVHSPVGLPLGARTAEEVGLAIMGAIVAAIRLHGLTAPQGPAASDSVQPVRAAASAPEGG